MDSYKLALDFCFMDLLSSIRFARSQRIISFGLKRNFFQKVAIWAEPNAQVALVFSKTCFLGSKRLNKRALNPCRLDLCIYSIF